MNEGPAGDDGDVTLYLHCPRPEGETKIQDNE